MIYMIYIQAIWSLFTTQSDRAHNSVHAVFDDARIRLLLNADIMTLEVVATL